MFSARREIREPHSRRQSSIELKEAPEVNRTQFFRQDSLLFHSEAGRRRRVVVRLVA